MAESDVHGTLTPGTPADAPLLRHRLPARIAHAVNALAIVILLITGLAVSGALPAGSLGGHLAMNNSHRWLGLLLSAALLLLTLAGARAALRLLRDILYFRWREWRWYPGFACHLLRPARHAPPFHDGRFDPAQRIVFACIAAALLVLCASGVYLFFSPPLPLALMGPMIRAHSISAWVLIGALCVHILAGSGLLPTHRRLAGAMFGHGRVSGALARGLWPGWANRQRRPQIKQDRT